MTVEAMLGADVEVRDLGCVGVEKALRIAGAPAVERGTLQCNDVVSLSCRAGRHHKGCSDGYDES